MSKVFVPQVAAQTAIETATATAAAVVVPPIKTASSSFKAKTKLASTLLPQSEIVMKSSTSSSRLKNSNNQHNQKSATSYSYNSNSSCNGNSKSNTTPLEDGNSQHSDIRQKHSQLHFSSSDESTNSNSEPESHNQLLDFDDLNSSSSIMEFLRQEQQCATNDLITPNGHDTEVDAESIFQEVSRLADNSDTRSVDELLREAEFLLQNQQYMGNTQQRQTKKSSPKPYIAPTGTSIKMNSKYTKRIENVNPNRDSLNKLVNGYGVKVSMLDECTPPLMTPETPTVTHSLSAGGGVDGGVDGGGGGSTFNNFVQNMGSTSVISEESTPADFQDDSATTVTQCSSNEENTTGKDVTTKQIDGEDTDDGTDTIEEITEAMETIEITIPNDHDNSQGDYEVDSHGELVTLMRSANTDIENYNNSTNMSNSAYAAISLIISTRSNSDSSRGQQHHNHIEALHEFSPSARRPSCDNSDNQSLHHKQTFSSPNLLASPLHRIAPTMALNTERCNSGSYLGRRSSMTTPDSGISSQTQLTGSGNTSAMLSQRSSSPNVKSIGIETMSRTYCDKSVNSSPVHMVTRMTSPISDHHPSQLANSSSNHSIVSLSREHVLKQEIEQLQERLKDTEERLESFRLQHDTVSQLHRKLRESNTQLQDDSEMLKLDVQHLNECANVLRSELQAARNDRDEALDLQKVLQNELEETRAEKKRAWEQKDKDAKHIQDLQRQCREMERILMRKHPDSVSALIVASKSSGISGKDQDSANSRKLLEQRIAQLEADAKEQDYKAQQILANVQARFNSVQSKYETHIADLETQVLSLQEINTKLNEKIESQVRTLDYFVSKKAEKFYNNCTQTEEHYTAPITPTPVAVVTPAQKTRKICRKTSSTQTMLFTRESGTNTIGTSSQHSASSSTSSTANSTPNNSRPNSKQSGLRKPMVTVSANHLTSAIASKLPVSQSDSTISLSASQVSLNSKDDAHLVATIRGMRVDLAIKNKALQRLTRELDECKKTMKKIQKDKDAFKYHSTASSSSTSSFSRLHMDHMPATTESQALKEAQSKCKLLEADYKSLHDKRLQDLKTLQTAHERELATCHETVRILQQRLNERDEQFAMQKRRKVPVDYYALKAKVSSLERRHTEREERLHMLVEALSKGRLNGALDDLLGDNNNQ